MVMKGNNAVNREFHIHAQNVFENIMRQLMWKKTQKENNSVLPIPRILNIAFELHVC